MTACRYSHICHRNGGEGTEADLCILHSQDPSKDKWLFDQSLTEHRVQHGANFSQFVFPGDAHFFEAIFSKKASFWHAKFMKEANFGSTTFSKAANFGGACFSEWASFSVATFTETAHFFEAAFIGGVEMQEASFTKEACFLDATFTKPAYFMRAKFINGADFSQCTFTESVSFHHARFSGRTIFSSREEDGKMRPIFSEAEVDFREAIIVPLDALIIKDADLRKCRFRGTDLRKAEITNARWPKIGSRVGVYDEIAPLAEGETRQWSHIERVYRQLKQNYEERRDYERACDFHYGEKEMRRKNPETAAWLRRVLWLYRWAGGYGERCLPPLFWTGCLFLASTLGYLWWGLCHKGETTRLALTSLWDWLRAAHYSLRVMFLLKPDDLVPVGYAKLVHTVESLVGPLLIGLFALALRQRLKR